MSEYDLYFMMHSIKAVRGGMTRAAIQRAQLLSSSHEEIGLLTFDYNPDYENEIRQFKEIGLWNGKMKHYNVYEFLMGKPENGKCFSLPKPARQSMKRTVDLDQWGRIRKEVFHDSITGKPTEERLLTASGHCFLKRKFNPDVHIWIDENGKEKKTFKRVRDYRHLFVRSLIKERDCILISDSRFTDRILFGMNHPRLIKAAVLHSNHLQSPFEYGSPLVSRNRLLFGQLNQLDAFILLTERQAEEIQQRYGRRSTIHTVGHPVLQPKTTERNHEPYTAVMLARYAGIKQIPHAIKAFKRVIHKVPEARLEIYGFGEEESKYRKLIKRLNMERHVFIKGFTTDIENVYRKAAFSLITSKSEAFGMSVIESLNVGTPVVCYDCKYGPSDIITHGKNGLLVRPGDVKALAAAMTDLFLDPEKRKALSEEAKKVREVFGESRLSKKWLEIFQAAKMQKEARVDFKGIHVELTSLSWKEQGGIIAEGKLTFADKGPALDVRHQVILLLQLRKRKDLQDLYSPLSVEWVDERTLIFKGEVSDFSELTKGNWDINISFSYRNFHQFIKPDLADHIFTHPEKRKMDDVEFRIVPDGTIQVFRPKKKREYRLPLLKERIKAKIREKIRRGAG